MKKTLAILFFAISSMMPGGHLTVAWACSVETDMGSGNASFTLKQQGSTLGSADVEGTVTGSKFEYSSKFEQGVLVYKGEIDGGKPRAASIWRARPRARSRARRSRTPGDKERRSL